MIKDNELNVDIVITGGGPAGYVAAIRASKLGATVALYRGKRNRRYLS